MTGPRRRRPRVLGVALVLLLAVPAGAAGAPAAGAADPARGYGRLMDDGMRNNGLGRYRAAEAAFRAALAACERRYGRNRPECGDATTRLAMEVSNQERFVEADLLFRRAETLSKRSRDGLDYPRYLTHLAMHLANRGRFREAFPLAVDANQRRKALIKSGFAAAGAAAGPVARQRLDMALTDLAHGLYVQAGIALALGRTGPARVSAHLARRLITKVDGAPDWWVAFIDELLAEIDLRKGRTRQAEKRLRLALKTKQLAFGDTRPVALSRLALGAIYQQRARNPEAVGTMRPGLEIVRGELGQMQGVAFERLVPFLKAAYAEAARRPAERDALIAEMFAASQLVRTSGISRTIAQMAARFASGRPEVGALVRRVQDAVRRRERLRLALGQAAVSFGGHRDTKRIARLRSAHARAAREAAGLEEKLLEVFPDYANFVAARPVPADALHPLLRRDEALVRFVIGDGGSFAFVLRGGRLDVAPLDITGRQLDAAVRHLRKPFVKAGRRIAAFDVDAAHRLYRRLFGPLENHLDGAGHVVTVASGALLSLPLGLLVEKPSVRRAADDYRGVAWFARRAAISMVPSVRAFAALRGTVSVSAAPLPFIGFGDPALSGRPGRAGMAALAEHCRTDAPVPPRLLRGLAPLPETAQEVTRVAQALGAGLGSVRLRGAATEAMVRRLPLDRYRIVYFATHGLLPGELRCQSEPALVLTPPPRATRSRSFDGLLDASEIAGLRLDADLVVLSACNTGGGSDRFGGEALSGLTRAFFQAGARALIVSHWQVDSRATARLMTRLFEDLAGGPGGDTARALRAAQLSMIADARTAHPFFWAAFTLVGAGAPAPAS